MVYMYVRDFNAVHAVQILETLRSCCCWEMQQHHHSSPTNPMVIKPSSASPLVTRMISVTSCNIPLCIWCFHMPASCCTLRVIQSLAVSLCLSGGQRFSHDVSCHLCCRSICKRLCHLESICSFMKVRTVAWLFVSLQLQASSGCNDGKKSQNGAQGCDLLPSLQRCCAVLCPCQHLEMFRSLAGIPDFVCILRELRTVACVQRILGHCQRPAGGTALVSTDGTRGDQPTLLTTDSVHVLFKDNRCRSSAIAPAHAYITVEGSDKCGTGRAAQLPSVRQSRTDSQV